MTKIKWFDFELDVLDSFADAIETGVAGTPDQVEKASQIILVQNIRRAATARRALINEGTIKPDPTVPIN